MKRIYAPLLALVSLLAVGCAGTTPLRDPVAEFAAATKATSANTIMALSLADTAYRDTQSAAKLNNYLAGRNVDLDYKPLITPAGMASRRLALGALDQYATRLGELVGEKQLQDLDASSRNLADSLKSFSGTDLQIADKTVLAAGVTAVRAVGEFIIDRQRAKAVSEAVRTMHPNVESIADMLIADIGEPEGSVSLRSQLKRDNDLAQSAREGILIRMRDKQKLSGEKLSSWYDTMSAKTLEYSKWDATLASVQDALRAMVDAHRSLLTAANGNRVTLVEIENFVARVNAISEFYRYAAK